MYEGGVKTATGAKVPGAKPAKMIAATDGLFAEVVAGTAGGKLSDGRTVEVRALPSGNLIGQFTASSPVLGVALTHDVVVVRTAQKIERHKTTGEALTTIPVKFVKGSPGDVSASSTWIVYSVGATIHAAPQVGKTGLVFTPPNPWFGLSVNGKRVVWSEQTGKGKARIQSLLLP